MSLRRFRQLMLSDIKMSTEADTLQFVVPVCSVSHFRENDQRTFADDHVEYYEKDND